jgi:hypothetical protein
MAVENTIMDEMLTSEGGMFDSSPYSTMDPKEKSIYDELAFKYYAKAFSERDENKYGKLSFENFISGLTPEEAFITELGKMAPDDESMGPANMWNRVFGENTGEMVQAALSHQGANDILMGMEDPRYKDVIAR